MKNRNHASVLTSGFTSIFTLVAAALLAALLPASVRAQAKPAADADIVARVNNDVVTLSDYQKAEQQLRDEVTRDCQGCPQDKIDAQFKEQQKDLLRGMIDQSLFVQRAKDMGISVESDLAKRLDEVRKQNGLATLDDLQKGVEASGLTWEAYKTTIRNAARARNAVGNFAEHRRKKHRRICRRARQSGGPALERPQRRRFQPRRAALFPGQHRERRGKSRYL